MTYLDRQTVKFIVIHPNMTLIYKKMLFEMSLSIIFICRIGRSQINALNKIGAYCQNPCLVDSRQAEIKEKCLQQWLIPNQSKFTPAAPNINNFLNQFLPDSGENKTNISFK